MASAAAQVRRILSFMRGRSRLNLRRRRSTTLASGISAAERTTSNLSSYYCPTPYRAALDRFLGFCQDAGIGAVDAIDVGTVEDFVKWLRGQTRVRNGASKGKGEVYKTGGIKFILSTCRTAMNWAGQRRMLPPFAENPFMAFPIDKLRDRDSKEGERIIWTSSPMAGAGLRVIRLARTRLGTCTPAMNDAGFGCRLYFQGFDVCHAARPSSLSAVA